MCADVPEYICHSGAMHMTDAERAALGARVEEERARVFGTKKAAYLAADVNPATWDKVEAGVAVRGDLLRKVIRCLWPQSEGDPRRIGADPVEASPGSVDVVLAELRDLREWLESVLTELPTQHSVALHPGPDAVLDGDRTAPTQD